ncbi:zinc finger protein 729-like [Wyeomyia smithii]|uniref:zinc finger protein 729-like n=1 Tax=Wyeomyia smithii TaxID=174621 RepID=UPI0024681370|nr:zinc finger protein 729-like [Wyeomyia smithii]
MTALACLTCTKSTEPSLSVTIGEHDNVQAALYKYFWFTEDERHRGYLCQCCWIKIEDFHRFYCDIEKAHGYSEYKIPTQYMLVKEEPVSALDTVVTVVAPDVLDVPEPLKCEDEDSVKSDSNDDAEGKVKPEHSVSEAESDQSADEETPLASRKTRTKRCIADDALISERIDLKCDSCSQDFGTFEAVQEHSLEEHLKRALVYCCKLKFSRKSRLVDHLRLHVNPAQFQCDKCSRCLPNSEALSHHKDTVHGSQPLECSYCGKTFSRAKSLAIHEKHHQRKWKCLFCKKYFASDASLRVHNSKFHREGPSSVKSEDETSAAESTNHERDLSGGDGDGDPDFEDDAKPRAKRRRRSGISKGPPRPADWAQKAQQLIAKYISLECDTCGHKFATFEELEQHGLAQHEKKVYVFCCEYKFSRKCRLMDHLQYHENPSKYQCDVCSKQFQNSESFKRHKDLAHREQVEKTLQCSMCPKTFAFPRSLRLHEKYHRSLSEKKWYCESCDKSFAWETLLRQHNRINHSVREFEHVCHICAKGYHTLSSYRSHVASHDANYKREKAPEELERVQCTICESWVFKKGLRKHMRNHTGSQTCDFCGQVCKSIVTLQYHMAQHKKADLACSVCEKTFKREISLKEHMASHTGEVLYTCDFCGKTFNSNANWSSHRKKTHPKEWLEDKIRKNPHIQLEEGHKLLEQWQKQISWMKGDSFDTNDCLLFVTVKTEKYKILNCKKYTNSCLNNLFAFKNSTKRMSQNMASPICLTCAEATDPIFAMPIVENEGIQTALSKLFWFTASQYSNSILCQTCWKKIVDFYQFYVDVERIHFQQENKLHLQLGSLKQESYDPELDGTFEEQPLSQEVNVGETLVKAEAFVSCFYEEEGVVNVEEPVLSHDEYFESTSAETIGGEPKLLKKRVRPRKRPPQPISEQVIAQHINLECDSCAQKFDSFNDLQRHSTTEHNKLSYVFCCDFKFCRKPRLIDHLLYHMNPGSFQCEICSKQFLNRESLKRHKDTAHTNVIEAVLKCSFCPKTFTRQKTLHVHEKYHRKLKENKWHCEICDKYFAYESILQGHNERKHSTKEFKLVCHVCAKGFHTQVSYTSHMACHDDSLKRSKQPADFERVQCTECTSWILKNNIKKHMLVHSGTQTCEHCGQECKSIMALRYHRAQHRAAIIECTICGKTFKQQLSLKEHMTTHTGEVLYSCDFCDKTFNSKANRAAHRKKIHPREWLEDKLRKTPGFQMPVPEKPL